MNVERRRSSGRGGSSRRSRSRGSSRRRGSSRSEFIIVDVVDVGEVVVHVVVVADLGVPIFGVGGGLGGYPIFIARTKAANANGHG